MTGRRAGGWISMLVALAGAGCQPTGPSPGDGGGPQDAVAERGADALDVTVDGGEDVAVDVRDGAIDVAQDVAADDRDGMVDAGGDGGADAMDEAPDVALDVADGGLDAMDEAPDVAPDSADGGSDADARTSGGDLDADAATSDGGADAPEGAVGSGDAMPDAPDAAVDGGTSDAVVVQVGAGLYYACALLSDGRVQCWGAVVALGDGVSTHNDCGPAPSCSAVPVTVAGLGDAVELSVGGKHACARRADGSVVCWGDNLQGQLGDGTTAYAPVPTQVVGLTDAVEIAAGNDNPSGTSYDGHTCARRATGQVVCWGDNYYGQLGIGTAGFGAGNSAVPVTVSGLADAVEIAVGSTHSCARRASGQVVCWGQNSSGQLGDGTSTDHAVPVTVSGLTDAVEISASGEHTCARRTSGEVLCWGWDTVGQARPAWSTANPVALVPTVVSGLTDAVEISTGGIGWYAGLYNYSCARRASGQVVCWGSNSYFGQLGDQTQLDRWMVTPVNGLTDAVAITAGGANVCALRADGQVLCWGDNSSGQIGDGTHAGSLVPVDVGGWTDAVEVSVGASGPCVRRASGQVFCWGNNDWGRLGDGTTTTSLAPVAVTGLTDAAGIGTGGIHTCTVRASGQVACWGGNVQGQLGDGTTTDRWLPVAVTGLTDAVEVVAGGSGWESGPGFTCARRASGQVVCWGGNLDGQLGDGMRWHTSCYAGSTTYDCSLHPVALPGLTDAVELAAGDLHACARRAGGQVVCWGDNYYGQLGDGTTINRSAPTAVSGLTDAVEITAGRQHTCARRASGQVVCWGDDDYGQLGDGSAHTQRSAPVVVGGLTDAVGIAAGQLHTCARRASGQVVCWGSGARGNLGNGTYAWSGTPVTVSGLTDAVEIAAGGGYTAMETCARRAGGQVVCWGLATAAQPWPTPVRGL